MSRTIQGRVQDVGDCIIDVAIDVGEEYPSIGADVTLTIHEPRYYADWGEGRSPFDVMDRVYASSVARFWSSSPKRAFQYAREHADRLNREATA